MRLLLFSLACCFYTSGFAQFAIERYYGAPSRVVSQQRMLTLPDGNLLHLYIRQTGDPAYGELYWRWYDAEGALVGEVRYGDPVYRFTNATCTFHRGHLYVSARRRRANSQAPGELRLHQFTLDGRLIRVRKLPESTPLFPRKLAVLGTTDGQLLIGLLHGSRAFHLYQLDQDWVPLWQRTYSVSTPATVLARADHDILLHEWPDGSSLAVVPFGGPTGVYRHSAVGELLAGFSLNGEAGYPATNGISALLSTPDRDTVRLLGMYKITPGDFAPARWWITPNAAAPAPEFVQDLPTSSYHRTAGVVGRTSTGGFHAFMRRGGLAEYLRIGADWAVTEQLAPTTLAEPTRHPTHLQPDGRIAQFHSHHENAYYITRLVDAPTDAVVRIDSVLRQRGHREYGEFIRELPNGEILIAGERQLTETGTSVAWLLWLDQRGNLLRERLLPELGALTLNDVHVNEDGSILLLTAGSILFKLSATGELLWEQDRMYLNSAFEGKNLYVPRPDSIYLIRAKRLCRINADTGFPTSLTPLQPRLEPKAWTFFNDQLHLLRMHPNTVTGELVIQTVALDGTERAVRSLQFSEERISSLRSVAATTDSLHLLFRGWSNPAGTNPAILVPRDFEIVLDTAFNVIRSTLLPGFGILQLTAASDSSTMVVYSDRVELRTSTDVQIFQTNNRPARALMLRDGRIVVTGSGRNNQDLWVAFTPAPRVSTPDAEETIYLYPNPTTGDFRWSVSEMVFPEGATQWQLFDAQGRLVRTEKMEAATEGAITLRGLSSGIYVFELRNGATRRATSLVVR